MDYYYRDKFDMKSWGLTPVRETEVNNGINAIYGEHAIEFIEKLKTDGSLPTYNGVYYYL